ncbi:DUF1348 family protein [Arthrobacter wenxiniae]|uniref:DUF1348 family protein n=1 Tax=Arthrobacter wenxiniae TaxID=2713570 RepID=UPI0031B5BA40
MRFQYEEHDSAGAWFRRDGNDPWEFVSDGLMRRVKPASTRWPSPRRTVVTSRRGPGPRLGPTGCIRTAPVTHATRLISVLN